MASSVFSPEPLPCGGRIACRVEYNGTHYNGWQSQPHPGTVTVQQALEEALAKVASVPVRVQCAGRTDAGVHGFAQIIHFDAPVSRSIKSWVMGANAGLPPTIRVHWAVPVDTRFHARFSALARRYRYVIANSTVPSALLYGQVTWHRRELDIVSMNLAAQSLLGEQDFSAFRAASCQSNTPMRNVHNVLVTRRGELVVIDIEANAFLHHMVRNIAGSLLAVGDARQSPDWISQLLGARDRSAAAATAPASGLYLVDVTYPEHFSLPAIPYGPPLLGENP